MYNGVKAMIEKEKELMTKDHPKAEEKKEEPKATEKPKEEEKKEEPKEQAAAATAGGEVGTHLKSAEELTACPKFPDGTGSLLCKCLSEDVWKELHDKKDKFGFTFKQAIFSGCKNVDSGIGIYAGSHDSYAVFASLMDKVIESYHGHSKEAKHVSEMDATKIKCPPLPEADAAMIVSTRIRVGRNLADFPLGPALSKEQRLEVEKKVTEALSSFEGDLKGSFYSLASMSDDQRNSLVADHFLFKEGDRFLEACGLNREWPEGRGIFHNNEKSFLVWVNEEDQLRIISMQKGADIGQVFERLCRATAHIEKVAKFAHDDHLGFITSCPTNLGTALRASVHIKLPKLGVQME